MGDHYNLQRFVDAQEAHSTYARVIEELTGGRKMTHWMWFVFPQIAGLGKSTTSRYFAISSLDEARAYFDHWLLGPRLLECSQIVAMTEDRNAEQIFGVIDAQKLRSSMTLFQRAVSHCPVFQQVLDRHFEGRADPLTEGRL